MDRMAHNNPMSAGVHSLWERRQLLDYTIQVEDQEFRVHKVIMASMSDYFQAMLTAGMADSMKDVVKIESVRAEIVKILIDFIYTNDITMANAPEILNGAVYLQIQPAIEKCTKFYNDNLDSKNCFEVLTLFRNYGLMGAVRYVKDYIKTNIRSIVKENCVLALSKSDFSFVVDNWQSSEMDLFKLIFKWAGSNKNQHTYVEDLLCSVRYSLMTPAQLSELIDLRQYCGMAKAWHHLVDKACAYHKLPLHQRVPDTSEQTKVRSAPSLVSISYDRNTPGYFYDPLHQKFESHENLVLSESITMIHHQTEVNNFQVVIGLHKNNFNLEWYIFDPRTYKWGDMAKPDAQMLCGATYAHNNKELYVVGGIHRESENSLFQCTIEQYNFNTNKWRTLSWMPVAVEYCGACIYDDGLYVSGGSPVDAEGTERETGISRMDRLDLLSCQWQEKAPMIDPCCKHSLHVMKVLGEDVICVFDEDIDSHCDNMTFTMEFYNPETNQWVRCPFTLNHPLEFRSSDLFLANLWMRGNSLFIGNIMWNGQDDGSAFASKLTFSEEGTDASVDHIHAPKTGKTYDKVLQIIPYPSQN